MAAAPCVADALDRHDDARVRRVALDLLPEVRDRHVDGARLEGRGREPYALEELGAGGGARALAMEESHEPDLARRELDRGAVACRGAATEIDRAAIDLDDLRRIGRGRA